MAAPQTAVDGSKRHAVFSQLLLQNAFVQRLATEFTTDEQKMFADSFLMYIAYMNDPGAFVLSMDDAVVLLGFANRDIAVRTMRAKLVADVDYTTTVTSTSQSGGPLLRGVERNKQRHMLTVDAFKMMCMFAGTAKATLVRRYFLKLQGVFMTHLVDHLTDRLNL